jgi:uncharacterized membrane protein
MDKMMANGLTGAIFYVGQNVCVIAITFSIASYFLAAQNRNKCRKEKKNNNKNYDPHT